MAGGRGSWWTTRSRHPALQRPLELGADITFHSSTKYLAGHSDTLGGIVVTNDDAVAERLRFLQNAMGAVPGPLDCFLVLRGLRTLHLRMERHSANGSASRPSSGRDDLEGVAYPRAAAWSRSCRDRGGPHRRDARRRAIAICEGPALHAGRSLGGVESLIEVPAVATHASVAGTPLEVPEALVRLSVGIEAADDLIEDLQVRAGRRLVRTRSRRDGSTLRGLIGTCTRRHVWVGPRRHWTS